MATPNLTGITTVAPGLLGSVQLSAGDNAVYTVGGSQAAKLTPLILTNTSASVVTVSVSVVPSGGTAGAANRVLSGYGLAPSETITVDEVSGMWLGAGAVVSVNASTGTAVTATLTGLVFS